MLFALEPDVGALPVRFGMPREEVRRVLGPEPPVVKKLFITQRERDTFLAVGAHVYYRDADVCEAVELFAPATPTFRGVPLLGRPLSDVAAWLRGLDPSASMSPTGIRSRRFGLACYVPNAVEARDAPVEGVLCFERGYFERHGVT